MDAPTPPWIADIGVEGRRVVEDCLRAAVNGPFFPDWEFSTLFGLERDEVRQVLSSWPASPDLDVQFQAVNGAFNNLLGYPHRRDDVWDQFVTVDREHLKDLYWRIRELSGANDQTREYIAAQLRRLAAMSADDLARSTALAHELFSAARACGVDVPEQLQELGREL